MDGAHRAGEGFDVMEILPGVGAKRVERQAALGPGLIEGVAEHRFCRNFRVDRLRNRRIRHARLLKLISLAIGPAPSVDKRTSDAF